MPALSAQKIPALKEVEAAINGASTEQRQKMLLGLTDLFLASQDGCSEAQIRLFDDILIKMTKRIEEQALIELSIRLSPQKKAPPNTLRSLAEHDSISIAGPVLVNSEQLTDGDLVEIAKSKSQAHLTMIARRAQLNEMVTDVLVDYGNADVLNEVAKNSGARISHLTMGKLVFCAERDDKLTVTIFNRQDVPPTLLRQLVQQATDAVRTKLMKAARPEQTSVVEDVMRDIAKRVSNTPQQDYAAAQKRVAALSKDTAAIKTKLYEFASTGRVAETAAAFAILAGIDIEATGAWLESSNSLALVMLCKALSLPWRTARAVLALCSMGPTPPAHAKEHSYEEMTTASAQRVLRFWQGRQSVRKQFEAAKKPAGKDLKPVTRSR
jgi:uncharacterized protein (DUF2336 family)